MSRFFTVLLLTILTITVTAEEELPEDLKDSRASLFWDRLYAQGGWTLYCGLRFEQPGVSRGKFPITINHIYPVSGMLKALACNSRMQCRDNGNDKFAEMENDLHNQYPVLIDLNNSLRESEYGEIEGETWRFENCDVERSNGIIEPRPLARGNIARSILYMHSHYNLPVSTDQLQVLIKWNREDPPSSQENIRNDRIEAVQGRRNPYIDNPALAENIARKQ